LHAIGEDTSEMLDIVPAQLRVRVIRRPRYACRACEEGVVQAPAPERPITGGMATEALLAQVLVAKYADFRVSRTHQQRRRCGAVREMRAGPSASAIRGWRQTAASCGRQERPW